MPKTTTSSRKCKRFLEFQPGIALVIWFSTAVGLAGSSKADFVALTFAAGGPPANANYFNGEVSSIIAYEFTPTQDLKINALGFYDIVTSLPNVPGAADGLAVPHQVGIYQVSDQALITSGTVPAGTTGLKVDSFRYTAISTVTLTAGVEYVIGATTGAIVNGVFGQDATVNANVGSQILANSGLTIGDRRTNSTGDGFSLTFPDFKFNLTSDTRGFGPNFGYISSFAVPEPSGVVLLGLGVLGAVIFAKSRRNAAA